MIDMTREIEIQMNDDTRRMARGEARGGYLLHRAEDIEGDGWAVSHAASGSLVMYAASEAEAEAVVAVLAMVLPSFDHTDADHMAIYRRAKAHAVGLLDLRRVYQKAVGVPRG